MAEDLPDPTKPQELEVIQAARHAARLPNRQNTTAVVKFFGFVFLFNALLWVFALFVQIRGWIDVTASYVLLGLMWMIGVLICVGLAFQSRIARKKTAITIGSLAWMGALFGLNAVAPKPNRTTPTVASQNTALPTAPTPSPNPVVPPAPQPAGSRNHKQSERPHPIVPKTEATQPILSAILVNPMDPAIAFDNSSDVVAEHIHWELIMFRITDHAFCSYATQTIDYVKGHSRSANYTMNPNSLPHASQTPQLVNGDRLVGTISVDCPTCKGVTLLVDFTWGIEGWFYAVPNSTGGLSLPRGMTDEAINRYIEFVEAIPLQKRQSIPSEQ